ncbi:hypothetical protein ONE63_009119 [Megalurothrips usitatus]|uniref:N(4)-(beta-N-acetylglucosaminyl)-L-asparaginase n=1 Tax=Megalurothrips usitatus TaxID=439358 RepID=A0AAV7XM85_9NEOP|nr:hypothetical protein ONE63_009119 [Megalurothrips usitatus]
MAGTGTLLLALAVGALVAAALAAPPQSSSSGTVIRAPASPVVITTWDYQQAVARAWKVLDEEGRSAVDAVEEGCSLCEAMQCRGTVGFGGSPDEAGETTLDAMIMDGVTMDVGAVAALRRVRGAISVARRVMDRTTHTLLAGSQATKFALQMGFPEQTLTTNHSQSMWQDWLLGNCQPNFWKEGVTPNPRDRCGPYRPEHAFKILSELPPPEPEPPPVQPVTEAATESVTAGQPTEAAPEVQPTEAAAEAKATEAAPEVTTVVSDVKTAEPTPEVKNAEATAATAATPTEAVPEAKTEDAAQQPLTTQAAPVPEVADAVTEAVAEVQPTEAVTGAKVAEATTIVAETKQSEPVVGITTAVPETAPMTTAVPEARVTEAEAAPTTITPAAKSADGVPEAATAASEDRPTEAPDATTVVPEAKAADDAPESTTVIPEAVPQVSDAETKANEARRKRSPRSPRSPRRPEPRAVVDPWNHDTIGMVAMDSEGRLAAGTSTNGARHKIPGRVGDSPIPGSGAFADQEVGAAAATGDGDIMMRFVPSFLAVELMRQGATPEAAAVESVRRIAARYPDFSGALIVLRRDGEYAAACHNLPVRSFPNGFPLTVRSASESTVSIKYFPCTGPRVHDKVVEGDW